MGEGQQRGLELTAEAEKGGCCDIQDTQMRRCDSGKEVVSGQIWDALHLFPWCH